MSSRARRDATRSQRPRLRRYALGVGLGLVSLAVMMLTELMTTFAPALGQILSTSLFSIAGVVCLATLVASPVCIFVRGYRLLGLGLFTGAVLTIAALGAWILVPYQLETNAMTDLIHHNLPLGAHVAQVKAFLHSRELRRFAVAHQLVETSDDQGPTQRVSRYDQAIVGLQEFPGGQSLFVEMTTVPREKYMGLQFNFDSRGRLTRYTVSSGPDCC